MTMSLQVEAVPGCQAGLRGSQALPLAPQHQKPASRADDNKRLEVPLAELTFRHLRSAHEIAGIVHLRRKIQLVAAGVADPGFLAREKKETRRASWLRLNAAAPSSARFASFP